MIHYEEKRIFDLYFCLHHRGILYHAEHIDIRHKNLGQLDGTDGNPTNNGGSPAHGE